MCIQICPYARFQSAMFDKDTFIVGYDPKRGETRGARSRKADYKGLWLGNCVDCDLCVQVCPTGIDIRDGLQYWRQQIATLHDQLDGLKAQPLTLMPGW